MFIHIILPQQAAKESQATQTSVQSLVKTSGLEVDPFDVSPAALRV